MWAQAVQAVQVEAVRVEVGQSRALMEFREQLTQDQVEAVEEQTQELLAVRVVRVLLFLNTQTL
jgi:hypothetical protein